MNSGKETHSHDDHQHGGTGGHLPAAQEHVNLSASPTSSPTAGSPAASPMSRPRATNAYLTLFYESGCDRGGIQIVDISDPAHPKKAGYIPSHIGTYSGEGSQVISMNNRFFKGDLLIYQNESGPDPPKTSVGGVTLADVTNPLSPKKSGRLHHYRERPSQRES